MIDSRAGSDPNVIPAEIDRWNWGAFFLNWIWGIGNNTFIALLTFLPLFFVIMPFVLGAKGSAWAWRNRRWDSIEHFKRVQRLWAIWGVIVCLGMIALFGGILGGSLYLLRQSDAYALGTSRLQASAEADNVLGTPISTGQPFGSVSVDGTSGRATLNFSATGPKATGQVDLEAVKKDGVWSLTKLTLTIDGRVIDLLNTSKAEIKTTRRYIG
jgi:hypothetical protein